MKSTIKGNNKNEKVAAVFPQVVIATREMQLVLFCVLSAPLVCLFDQSDCSAETTLSIIYYHIFYSVQLCQRLVYLAMAEAWDEMVRNMTTAASTKERRE